MTRFPWEVIVLAAVLAVNRLLVPTVARKPAAFWAIQAMNLGIAAYVLVFGVPGLDDFPVVNWLVAGLLVFHILQNFGTRNRVLEVERRRVEQREIVHLVGEATRAGHGPRPSDAPPERDLPDR